MDFTLSNDQRALRDLAGRILSDATSDEALRDFAASGGSHNAELWKQLADAGLLGLGLSEEVGGLGMGAFELGLVLEEQGRTLAPVPLTATIALAATAIDRHGSKEQRDKWLPGVIAGDILLTAAIEELGGIDYSEPATAARPSGNNWRLSGEKMAVPYAEQSDAFLVTAMTDQGPALFLVERGADGVTIDRQESTSGEPQGLIKLNDVAVSGDAMIGEVEEGAEIVADLIMRGQVALSQRQVGVAAEALRRTAEYSSSRIQFGKALGSMQAVQQRAADSFIDVEAMRSTSLLAAWQIDEGKANIADVATAKYWAAIGGHRVVHTAQHLHGGMGADVTYPIHRYFLTATQIAEALGGANPMVAAIGRAVAAGETEPMA